MTLGRHTFECGSRWHSRYHRQTWIARGEVTCTVPKIALNMPDLPSNDLPFPFMSKRTHLEQSLNPYNEEARHVREKQRVLKETALIRCIMKEMSVDAYLGIPW